MRKNAKNKPNNVAIWLENVHDVQKIQNLEQRLDSQQKYRFGTISRIKSLDGGGMDLTWWFYMTITSPSASAVVHNIKSVVWSSW